MTILDYLGIKSFVVEGSACLGLVYGNNPYRITWGGFWDKDHHYWLTSEYGDIIDFTISKLHIHPYEKIQNQVPILPIWWTPIDISPPIFKYLPKTFGRPQDKLEKEESIKLKEFKDDILKIIEEGTLNSHELNSFEILTGREKFIQLYEQRNTWIYIFIEKHKELKWPDWILNREQELIQNYRNNLKH